MALLNNFIACENQAIVLLRLILNTAHLGGQAPLTTREGK